MNFVRIIFLLSSFLTLGGCAALTELNASFERARAEWDAQNKLEIGRRHGAVSYRADTLRDKPHTMAALQRACAQGRYVEVFIHVNELPLGAQLQRNCVRVFFTIDNGVLHSSPMLLLDGGQLVSVNGNVRYLKSHELQQELRYRAMLRAHSSEYAGDVRIRPF